MQDEFANNLLIIQLTFLLCFSVFDKKAYFMPSLEYPPLFHNNIIR